jgi:hypothetical protein
LARITPGQSGYEAVKTIMKIRRSAQAKNKARQAPDPARCGIPQKLSVAPKAPVLGLSPRQVKGLRDGAKRVFDTAPDLDDLVDMVARLKTTTAA